jgi:hypothetical protein
MSTTNDPINAGGPYGGAEGEDCPAAVSQAGLARAVEVLERRVAELARGGKRVDELAAIIERLAQQAAAGAATDSPSKVAPSWLDHEPTPPGDPRSSQDAEDMLTTLAKWVGGIYLRYSDARLPDCWLWHPDVVEELLWLHAAWLAAYDPDSPVSAAGDWHDRQRPGVAARIKTYAGMCSLEAHLPDKERHTPAPTTPTVDAVPTIAAWWATRREQPGPIPTQEQIAMATERMRRSRR